MPKWPQGQKRPAVVTARAVIIAKIATGEIKDVTTEDGKNAAAVALGRMGGKAGQRACRPASAGRSQKKPLPAVGQRNSPGRCARFCVHTMSTSSRQQRAAAAEGGIRA